MAYLWIWIKYGSAPRRGGLLTVVHFWNVWVALHHFAWKINVNVRKFHVSQRSALLLSDMLGSLVGEREKQWSYRKVDSPISPFHSFSTSPCFMAFQVLQCIMIKSKVPPALSKTPVSVKVLWGVTSNSSNTELIKYYVVPRPLVSPTVCGWCNLTPDLDPTPVGSHGFNWSSISCMEMSPILHSQIILQSDLTCSHDLWPSFVTSNLTNMWIRFLS